MGMKFTYRVFEEDSRDKLEVKVEQHLEVGYAFVGGASAVSEGLSPRHAKKTYVQAMVLYHE